MERIKQKINNRTVAILSHGKSIEELEDKIYQFKDKDVCWVSFNYWQLMEEFVLSKIDKKLDIILDCANAETLEYEEAIRIPFISKLLKRNTLVLSLQKVLDGWSVIKQKLYQDRIVLLDKHFDISTVANTLVLLIYAIAQSNPKEILLFGVDGYIEEDDGLSSYYKPDFQLFRRLAIRLDNKATLKRETNAFNNTFFSNYKKLFNKEYTISTINYSKDSKITIFNKEK